MDLASALGKVPPSNVDQRKSALDIPNTYGTHNTRYTALAPRTLINPLAIPRPRTARDPIRETQVCVHSCVNFDHYVANVTGTLTSPLVTGAALLGNGVGEDLHLTNGQHFRRRYTYTFARRMVPTRRLMNLRARLS